MSPNKMLFADEAKLPFEDRRKSLRFWNILVVDDEHGIHEVTELATRDMSIHGQHIKILSCYSAAEAIEFMRTTELEIPVILMDVVMESEYAGLEVVDYIRNALNNKLVRIIIRTGQSGQAPEHLIIKKYDINDYKEKTELTVSKLYTSLYTAVSQYRQLKALEDNRRGLENVIKASSKMYEHSSLRDFSSAILEQLISLIFDKDAVLLSGFATSTKFHDPIILAGIGAFKPFIGYPISSLEDKKAREKIYKAITTKRSINNTVSYTGYFEGKDKVAHVVYVQGDKPIPTKDKNLFELFIKNVSIIHDNLKLHEAAVHSQTKIILLLSQAIEERSMTQKYHIKRVSEYARALGKLNGLSEDVCDVLSSAAMLHDAGKISIPDSILQKPGRLSPEERKIMETHALKGQELLQDQEGELLVMGAIVAGQHHERWDGTGYPLGLQEEDIHLFGRITALVDVFDALTSKRCYKEAWPINDAIDYVRNESGKHFDPKQVDLFLKNIDIFLKIKVQYVDDLTT